MKIIIDDKIPFIRGVFEPFADVDYRSGAAFGDVTDADALIVRTRTKCNAALLEGSHVKFVATATIGYDHIDTAWCEANGITWTNAPGCNSGSVKQYIGAVLATLAARHGFNFGDITLGVVGVGNVGSKVAQLGRTLGMNVILNDPPRARREGNTGFVTLDELIGRSDIITLHVPLNLVGDDATYHLFDEERIRSLKQTAILINSSRGEVVDNKALRNTLTTKRIRGAVLDVWEHEPDIDRELLALVDIGTPHIAGYSADGKANGTAMSVQALSRFFGLPLGDWRPSGIPKPKQQLHFALDGNGKSAQACLNEAILLSYPIEDDFFRLRQKPAEFEKQRGDYPVRREFEAFLIDAYRCMPEIIEKMHTIGFIINVKK